MFRFVDQKVVCCGFRSFFQFIVNHCVCLRYATLKIGNTHEHTVRRQTCGLSRASGVIAVVSGPSIVSVVFRLVRPWLVCSSGCWLRLFVARFWQTLVEMFAELPLKVSCFLSCRVGVYVVAR